MGKDTSGLLWVGSSLLSHISKSGRCGAPEVRAKVKSPNAGHPPKAVIPPKRNRKMQREYDKDLYRQRNRIERCFSRLKCFRRFATRYEKSKACFHALVALACAWLHLRLYVDTA